MKPGKLRLNREVVRQLTNPEALAVRGGTRTEDPDTYYPPSGVVPCGPITSLDLPCTNTCWSICGQTCTSCIIAYC